MVVNRVGCYLSSKYCHEIASKNGQMHLRIVVAKKNETNIYRERENETDGYICTQTLKIQRKKNWNTHTNNNQVYFALQMRIATEHFYTNDTTHSYTCTHTHTQNDCSLTGSLVHRYCHYMNTYTHRLTKKLL